MCHEPIPQATGARRMLVLRVQLDVCVWAELLLFEVILVLTQ